jgi:hypothetical protein
MVEMTIDSQPTETLEPRRIFHSSPLAIHYQLGHPWLYNPTTGSANARPKTE